ncbi:Crp/Fnr family transcriptional regulator [Listeria sp. PSOL-1]|uniref:Crp/Fnr family transcriptional regulator n=1 Tax=Listeria sp. PSOL-1 TaxID=1844999 RepID=UPI0013D25560|nr:Crp/Fnr family transcriptional regulator [Listeria sp. PSOL-1]
MMYRKAIQKGITMEDIIQELRLNAYRPSLVKSKKYSKNEVLQAEDVHDSGILFIQSGYIGKYMSINHYEKLVDFHAGFDLIGFNEILVPLKEKNYCLRMFDPVHVIVINADYLLDYLSIRPVFMEYLVKKMANKLHNIALKEAANGKYQRDRVVSGLLAAAVSLGATNYHDNYQFPSVINHYLLANYCRIDPASFSKVCKKLVAEKLIYIHGRQIELNVCELRASISTGYERKENFIF